MTLGNWLKQARHRLTIRSEQPGLEAAALAAFVLQCTKTEVLAHPEITLLPAQQVTLEALLSRLSAGEPLPYLLGAQEFFGLAFTVSPSVLIPRPETELLVEQALSWLRAHPDRRKAADVGTGSGCIAISLAYQVRDLAVTACDLSLSALQVARENAHRHHVDARLNWLQSDLLSPLSARFDLVCANLPYIPTSTLRNLAVAAYEPHLALDGGPDGLAVIRRLVNDAARWLSSGGLLLLEIEATQGTAARELCRAVFPQARVELLPDLAGLDRVIRIEQTGRQER